MDRILRAGAKTILLFGLLHILVLLVGFLRTGDFSLFNVARILEINRIFPVDIAGSIGNTAPFLFIALAYGIVYLRFTK